jgi:ankyrin repeat protein
MADTAVIRQAAIDGDMELLRQLASSGMRILLDESMSELTALHLAAGGGHVQVVELLLRQGADPRALRQNKFSALHAAAMHGHAGVIEVLLAAGASPNVQTDPQLYAPLHSAAWAGHNTAVAALLAAGALPLLRNYRKLTAAEVARTNGHTTTADLLDADLQSDRANPLIGSFGWGRIEDSSKRVFKDARLYPGGAAGWDWTRTGTHHQPGIQFADVEDLLSLRPATVILTRGVNLVLEVPERTVERVREAGPEVLVLQTEDAVREYNRRVRTERVVALVHSTC